MENEKRRPGSETRSEILRVALELFTDRGFEGASIRDLAEAVGMTKSSLYYHFASKDAILAALMENRRDEVDDLLTWVDDQPRTPDLLRRTALRWVDSTGEERLQGMRFAHANGPVMQRLAADGTDRRSLFGVVIDRVLPGSATVPERLRAQIAFDSVSAALFAAQGTTASDAELLAAAREVTMRLTDDALAGHERPRRTA
ncbi:TetR/AcrR family transcriptional regulator [Curtobacterium sp. VKM Ac-2865]|uniref:TetR/AcrR family transcriptional regulator n=1 Tax=Curtobacterium sp. VKM Ac-2865 TaxID=2783817 RepID=UPI00188B075B|nr:TetR/AcrR family transcriptional regulator [Curtobacterium sp. VKM Ac-2865]MBF4583762.1 TetR/AcrR family transcriptional regulator [Curtobacterium sp. VKM Ac-2865]